MAGTEGGEPLRLIVLKQGFDPEPSFKGLRFAKKLVERGFDVEVVTGFPNYPEGKIYEGYRLRPIAREEMEGIKVTRLLLYPSHDRNPLRRAFNYGSFFLSAFLYLAFVTKRADVIYVYHPPLTVGLAAAAAKVVRRVPFVLDIQDMWPDTLRATGMLRNPAILRGIGALSRWTYRRADRISVLSPGFKETLVSRGVPPEKVTVVFNWADEGSKQCGARAPVGFDPGHKFRLLFAGNTGKAQGLVGVIEAAKIVAERDKSIGIYFLGSGIELEALKKHAGEGRLENVKFLPRVPMSEVAPYLAASDCLLVHLKADPLFEITIPSKTQAYMAAGKPILMAVNGDAADLVRRSGAGITVAPDDPAALADAIMHLASLPPEELVAMGQNGRAFYEAHLSLERGTEVFSRLLREASDDARGCSLEDANEETRQ